MIHGFIHINKHKLLWPDRPEALIESPIIHNHTQNIDHKDKQKHVFLHSGHCLPSSSMIIISNQLIKAAIVMATLLSPLTHRFSTSDWTSEGKSERAGTIPTFISIKSRGSMWMPGCWKFLLFYPGIHKHRPVSLELFTSQCFVSDTRWDGRVHNQLLI